VDNDGNDDADVNTLGPSLQHLTLSDLLHQGSSHF
jgi:hypothetical protein